MKKLNQNTVTIVVPAYNEEKNIAVITERLKGVLARIEVGWEIIFIDDGSEDDTWRSILELSSEDGRIKGLRFSRNFGHQYALLAGLGFSRGSAVISMDADLQHPPEIIPQLISEWRKGFKIVNTIRQDPENISFFKKYTSQFFYAVFSYLSGVELKQGMADFRLMDRQVVDQLIKFRENGLFLRGLVQWVGYPNSSVVFQCDERFSGTSKYTVLKMLKLAWHGISSFSIVPLRIGISIGVIACVMSTYFLIEALYAKFVLGTVVPGWTSTIAVISLLFGLLFIFLGFLGEYIGRILEQVRGRPLYLISSTVGMKDSDIAL